MRISMQHRRTSNEIKSSVLLHCNSGNSMQCKLTAPPIHVLPSAITPYAQLLSAINFMAMSASGIIFVKNDILSEQVQFTDIFVLQ